MGFWSSRTINLLYCPRKTQNSIPLSYDQREASLPALIEIICGGGNYTPAALLVLITNFAFTRCGELNLYDMVDAQTAFVESKLLATNSLVS
jgi:hypothetical protein